jgi:hypothetical protein
MAKGRFDGLHHGFDETDRKLFRASLVGSGPAFPIAGVEGQCRSGSPTTRPRTLRISLEDQFLSGHMKYVCWFRGSSFVGVQLYSVGRPGHWLSPWMVSAEGCQATRSVQEAGLQPGLHDVSC